MMDIAYVSNLEGIGDPEAFSRFVCDRYMYYRGEKYGQEGFWESASTERENREFFGRTGHIYA